MFQVPLQDVANLPSGTLGLVTIPASTPAPFDIYTVKATDADEGQNALVFTF